jgi:PAS domain S-box-containing protein
MPPSEGATDVTAMRGRLIVQIGVVVALLAMVLVAVLLLIRHRWEEARERDDQRVHLAASAVRDIVGDDVSRVGTVAGLFESSRHVTAGEFAVFARRVLDDQRSLNGVSFTARVTAAERAGWERRMGRPIVEPVPTGAVPVPAAPRPVYYPITYAVGRGHPAVAGVGVDVGADPSRREALERARAVGRPQASAPVLMIGGAGAAVIVYTPIRRTAGDSRSPGFAVAVLRLDRISEALAQVLPPGLRVRVRDAASGGLLASVGPPWRGGESRELTIAGRRWTVAAAPASRAVPAVAWVVVAAGVLLAGLLAALLVLAGRRERYVREDLHEAQERLRTAFERSPIGLALVSVVPGEHGRYLQVNAAMCDITGRSEAELLATTFAAVTHPDDREDGLARMARLESGEAAHFHVEKRYLRPDGSTVHVEIDAGLVRDVTGMPLYAIALVRDVDERYELERLKSEFLALTAHELRTPLTALLGFVEFVLQDGDELTGDHREMLQTAVRRGGQLTALVGDVNTLAGADAGRVVVNPAALDLADLAAETVAAARGTASDRGVELWLEPASGPLTVWGDRTRLGQVLDNLISNAVKFTPPGGRIEVRAGRDGAAAVLSVADTGIGIAQEEQDSLFERFFRTRAATELAIPGTGLGLAICRAIVEAHDGEIAVTSGHDEGTTVTVRLALHAAGPADATVGAARSGW